LDWPAYLGGKERNLYSPLKQIHRGNVTQLEVAWTYETGDNGEYQANNLIVDGALYTASPARRVIALDAATGRELWKWDPAKERSGKGAARQRGLVYWKSETGEARLFSGVGGFLFALDAKTGEVIRSFGENGSVNLGSGLNTPGVIYKDALILGGVGGAGSVRALDVRTGQQRWIFHLIPRPGEVGYDTWPPDAHKTATGVMPWCGQSLDEARGIVYVATKTAEPGLLRRKTARDESLRELHPRARRRHGETALALSDRASRPARQRPAVSARCCSPSRTRAKRWTPSRRGRSTDCSSSFNRVTGEPLWPIEERPAPASDLRGEKTWATQPFPTKPAPLMRQRYMEEDASDSLPETHQMTLDRIRASPNFRPIPRAQPE
jgi:quinoprotein glucose dehydrogenase